MKVLFHAYNTCCQTESGGVQVRIRKIKKLLEERGIQVDFFNAYETKIKDYDVLHLFYLKSETSSLISTAKKYGLKIVVSPIVNTTPYRAKSVRYGIMFGRLIRHFCSSPDEYIIYNSMKMVDFIFAESKTEADFITKYYKFNPDKIKIVPNGVDEPVPASKAIYGKIGKECKYVLQAGSIYPNKNLLNTIKAVKDADYQLVVVGGKASFTSDDYYNQCVEEAKKYSNVHMLGWLDPNSDLLASAYQNAQAVIMPSKSETFGLVAIEAAMAGAHVCLSNNLPILDFGVFKKEFTFDSSNIQDIRRVLDLAIITPKNDEVKNKAREVFSWDKIIDEHIDTYKA